MGGAPSQMQAHGSFLKVRQVEKLETSVALDSAVNEDDVVYSRDEQQEARNKEDGTRDTWRRVHLESYPNEDECHLCGSFPRRMSASWDHRGLHRCLWGPNI